MLKTILMASSMLVAVPVFAQDAPAAPATGTQQSAPAATGDAVPATTAQKAQKTDGQAPGTQGAGMTEEVAPAAGATAPAAETAQPTPAQPAPAPEAPAPAAAAQPAPEAAGTTGAGTTEAAPAAQPATTGAQVADAVNRDFATYDKDGNGALSQAEFGSWMGTLRQAADPSFQSGSADATTWLGQAFAAGDADKNQSVSKAELTTFLTPKTQ